MKVKKHIPLTKKYNFPKEYDTIHHANYYIIMAPEYANYIVLENKEQLDFFHLLEKYTIEDAIRNIEYPISSIDIQKVLIQIEGKKFSDEKIEKSDGIFQLHFMITNKCNLRCRHCYMKSGEPLSNELTTEEIKNFLNLFAINNGQSVVFSGGEVCARPDYIDIIQYAHKLGLSVNIMTNGTLWNENNINAVKDHIASIQISLDGFNEDENSKIRGSGNFSKSLGAVEKFLKHNIPTTIAMTPWPDEMLYNNLQKYVDFRTSLMKKYEGFPLEVKFTAEIMDGRELKISQEEKEKYYQNILKVSYEDKSNTEEEILKYNLKHKIIKNNWCTYGHLVLMADGTLFFCGKTNIMKPHCNIRTTDLTKIFADSLKARNCSNINNIYPCKDCSVRYLCGGECRIEYFPEFRDSNNIIKENRRNYRKCNEEKKAHLYDLLIKINEDLFIE